MIWMSTKALGTKHTIQDKVVTVIQFEVVDETTSQHLFHFIFFLRKLQMPLEVF